jgi:hypothetical protein
MTATQANGATEINANADSDHQGVTDELRDTIETGKSWVSVNVLSRTQPNALRVGNF